jgi:hypothetical protein
MNHQTVALLLVGLSVGKVQSRDRLPSAELESGRCRKERERNIGSDIGLQQEARYPLAENDAVGYMDYLQIRLVLQAIGLEAFWSALFIFES